MECMPLLCRRGRSQEIGDPDNDNTNEDDENCVEEVVDNSKVLIDSFDPFDDTLVAPEGYCFFGKLSFLCL